MEKAFEKGFLLKGSTKPKSGGVSKKGPSGCNDPNSEAKPLPLGQHKNSESLMLELPKELLEHIFMFLDPGTIKSVACVCKWWKKIVEKRSFWKWARVKMKPIFSSPSCTLECCTDHKVYTNSIQKLNEIVRSHRLKFLEEIHLLDTREIRGHINVIWTRLVQMDNLKKVVLSVGKPGKIYLTDPEAIAKLATSVENFELTSCDDDEGIDTFVNAFFYQGIIPAIMRELVSNAKSKTKSLNIHIQGGYILRNVDPDLFSRGAMKLENLSVKESGMTQQQGQNILECLATSESVKLKHLSLDLNLINICPKILSEAVSKLTQLDLCRPSRAPEMTYEQVFLIFRKMKSEESALKRLSLSGSAVGHSFDDMPIRYGVDNLHSKFYSNRNNFLTLFSSKILVDGFLSLTSLTLSFTEISRDATILLFCKIASSKDNLKLRCLNLGRDQQFAIFSHLPQVEPETFATAVCKLEEVDVQYNNLSLDQMNTLFTKMMQNKHCLKKLVVSYAKRFQTMSDSVVSEALLTVKDIEFWDLSAKYFNHFIEQIKVTPSVKTRYIQIEHGTMRYQRMLEAALTQNEVIRFTPHRTHPQMVGWREPTENEMVNRDYDRVREMNTEEILHATIRQMAILNNGNLNL